MLALSQELWGVLSVCFALGSLVPYLYSTLKTHTRPHVFTWVIWSFITVTAFFVQSTSGAGPGAWATGVTAFFCLIITAVSFKKGEKEITRSDWATFIAAIVVIPVWMSTKNATLAAIWITCIDLLAYYPTYRKTWRRPHQEMALSRGLSVIKHIFSLLALERVAIATALYPFSLVLMNSALFILILWRRRLLGVKPGDT